MAEINITVTEELATGLYAEQAKAARDGAVVAKDAAEASKITAESSATIAADGAAYVDSIVGDNITLPNRLNTGENGLNPSFKTAVPNNLVESYEADTFSPFKHWGLGYLRRLTSGAASGTSFSSLPIPIGTNAARPNRIEVNFWLQDSNINDLFSDTGIFSIYYTTLLGETRCCPKSLILSEGTQQATVVNYAPSPIPLSWTSTTDVIRAATTRFIVLNKYMGWTKVSFVIENITWDTASMATVRNFVLFPAGNSAAALYNKYLYLANVEVLHNTTSIVSTLYNYPSADGNLKFPTDLANTLSNIELSIYDNNTKQNELTSKVASLSTGQIYNTFLYNSGNVYMRSYYDSTYDIVTISNGGGNSTVKLILKSDAITATGITLTNGGDDAAPFNFNGYGYIGGNHGAVSTQVTTVSAHGKTTNDIASIWVDSTGKEFYILQIINTTNLIVLSKNYGTSNTPSFVAITGTTLTHVSGAVNTSAIAISSTALYQIPPKKNESVACYADGIAVVDSADMTKTFTAKNVVLKYTYEVADILSTISKIIASKPVGGYTSQPSLTQGDSMVKAYVTQTFNNDASVVIDSEFETFKDLSLNYYGMTQCAFFNPIKTVGNGLYNSGASNTYKRFIPKVLPIDLGYGGNSDFRTGVNIENSATGDLFMTSGYFENQLLPPDRNIDVITNGSNFKAAFSITYLPYGVGGVKRKDNTSAAWYLYMNTRKNYCIAVNSILNIGGVLPSATYKQGAVQRKWTNLAGETNHTIAYFAEHGNDVFLYADYHQICNDAIAVPFKYRGRTIEVVEKSSNVEVLSDVATDTIRVKVTTASPLYGYVVLKLK